ncbi:MAG: MMPL family transporter [Bacteroidales bacterium]|nr:MMPL family transporter [Bacteroidales bacterium]
MWNLIASIILRKKSYVIAIVAVLTAIMLYFARNVQMSYELAQMLPKSDTTFKEYLYFKELFGEDGSVMMVGVTDSNFFTLEHFTAWYDLNQNIKKIHGVEEVASPVRILNLTKNETTKKFSFEKVVKQRPSTQKEVDSIRQILNNLAFYKNLLYNPDKHFYAMAITIDKKRLSDKSRVQLLDSIECKINEYTSAVNLPVHISGLPYIRTQTTEKVKSELYLFIVLSIIVSVVVLIGLFRSFRAVFASLLVVGISVIFTLGLMGIFKFKISILTGIVPSLLIIIGIENCIFLLNRYLSEYSTHQNKVKALSRIIQRIGTATFLTNLTTAVGFATFILSPTSILKEFGIIASINILIEFLLSLTLIPIILSFLPVPKERHIKHLQSKKSMFILSFIENIIIHHKKFVIVGFILLIIMGIWGMTRMETSGKMVDDLKETDPIFQDLKYFEQNIGGIMPFEIIVNTQKRNGVMQLKNIEKIDKLQQHILSQYSYFSKPISVVELVKFAKQAYYNGNTEKYSLPKKEEASFILSYLPGKNDVNDTIAKKSPLHAFLDSSKQITRISFQMADIGLKEMNKLKSQINPVIDSIFPKDKYKVIVTGNSVVYTKGTEYLIYNLLQSVILAIIVISFIMGMLFTSFRMILIAIFPNLIPLLVVAGLMGFFHINVKPSTIIVFSIALGIAVDNAIHFLTRYRFELRHSNYNVQTAVINALHGNGISMLSSLLVLVLGFGIFVFSDFGGTQAMGILVTLTLIFSLLSNIILMPMLIYSFAKSLSQKSIDKPMLEIFDEPSEETTDEKITV